MIKLFITDLDGCVTDPFITPDWTSFSKIRELNLELSLIHISSISASKKEYLFLVLIHFLGGMISFLFVLLGINYFVNFLIVPDLLSRYLIPLCSLGLVALTYVQDREAVKYEE